MRSTGGRVELDLQTGDIDDFVWGFKSGNDTDLTKVKLNAAGEGSEFLHFPDSIFLDVMGTITAYQKYFVKIPTDYVKSVILRPVIYATVAPIKIGQHVIIVRHAKRITLNINQETPEITEPLPT